MNDMKLMRGILNALHESDDWTAIETSDPAIQKASSELKSVFEEVHSILPAELFNRLWCAVADEEGVLVNAAMLFGLRAGLAILRVAGEPESFSQYLLSQQESSLS